MPDDQRGERFAAAASPTAPVAIPRSTSCATTPARRREQVVRICGRQEFHPEHAGAGVGCGDEGGGGGEEGIRIRYRQNLLRGIAIDDGRWALGAGEGLPEGSEEEFALGAVVLHGLGGNAGGAAMSAREVPL